MSTSPFIPSDPDDVPWTTGPSLPRDTPLPLIWHQQDGTVVELSGEDIAMWVHCGAGMDERGFLRWLLGELDTLEAIDPYCSK